MKPLSAKKRKIYFTFFSLLFVICIPVIILYAIGYRWGDGLFWVRTGGIFVNVDESGTDIYIDKELVRQTSFLRKDLFVQNLKPGGYEIMVSKKGYHTWRKTLEVHESFVSEAYAFMLPVVPFKREIPRLISPDEIQSTTSSPVVDPDSLIPNDEYELVVNLFSATTTLEKPVVATASTTLGEKIKRKVSIWKERNTIYTAWNGDSSETPYFFCEVLACRRLMSVYTPQQPILYFDFYPGRNDVIIVARLDGIYAVELDPSINKNIQPVYTATGATFRIAPNGTVYIKDKDRFFSLEL